MPTNLPFSLVDVFAEAPLTGNPLALVTEADGLDEAQMGLIAREFNQSETTFLQSPRSSDATWRLRSYTPTGAEVVGAGHNALGAWWWLAASGKLALDADGAGTFAQEIGDRVLPVEVLGRDGAPQAIGMQQAPPEFRRAAEDREQLAGALGLTAADLADAPAQVVDTGAPHLLVPLRDRATVDQCQPDASRLFDALAAAEGQGCYVYALDPIDPAAVAYTRFFNPTVGIWEDPATGSAAGPLACQLVARSVVPDGSTIGIEQGHAMGRPSRIAVYVEGSLVRIDGAGVVVAEGTLSIGAGRRGSDRKEIEAI